MIAGGAQSVSNFKPSRKKWQRLVSLCGTKPGMHEIWKDSHDRDSGMKLQVLSNLAGSICEVAALLKQYRRCRTTGGQHDCLRLDANLMTGFAGKGLDDPSDDAGRAPSLGQYAFDPNGREHPSAPAKGLGNVTDVHRLLGSAATSRKTLSAASASANIAKYRLAVVPERVAAIAKQQIPTSEYIFGCWRNTQKLCDRLVVGIEVGARGAFEFEVGAPAIENERGRAIAYRRVHQRATTERNRLHGGHDGATRRAQAALSHGARHGEPTVEFVLGGHEGRSLLDQHDGLAGVGEFLGDHRAGRARAHHDHVGLQREVPVVLGEDANLSGFH